MDLSSSITNNYPLSWSEKLTGLFNPYHSLEKRISAIGINKLTQENIADLQQVFKLAHQWTWPAGKMRKLISTIPTEVIKQLVVELLETGNEKEIAKLLHTYLKFLSNNALLDISELSTPEKAASWFLSRGLLRNSVLKSAIEKESRVILQEFAIEFKYFIHHILDILISRLGLSEIGADKHSMYENRRMGNYADQNKLDIYLKLLAMPAAVFGFFSLYVTTPAIAAISTVITILSMLTSLVAYQRYWKPCPKEHTGLKNVTIDMLNPKEPIYPRPEILKDIQSAFAEKMGVILVGEPGAGKSSVARYFAQQMADKKICTFIKNGQVFSSSASKFKSKDYMSPTLNSIEERFNKYNEEVVFFFDEFHSLFKNDGLLGSNSEEEIKMFCEEFKYVIGATTSKEFEELIKDKTAIVDRRFKIVYLNPLEDHRIKIVLSQYLQTLHPEIDLGKGVLEHIISNSKSFNKNTSKIHAAQTLLNKAINKMNNIEFKDLELKILGLEEQLKKTEQDLMHVEISQVEELNDHWKEINKNVEELRTELRQKTMRIERMKKIEAYHLKLKQQSFKMADPAKKLIAGSSLEKEWITLNAQIKMIADFLIRERKKHSLSIALDIELIDSISGNSR